MQEYQLWIAGQWQDSAGGGHLTIVDPATEQPIADLSAEALSDYQITKHVMIAQ